MSRSTRVGEYNGDVERAFRARHPDIIDARPRRHRSARNDHHVALAHRREDLHPLADEIVADIVHFRIGDDAAIFDFGIDFHDAALSPRGVVPASPTRREQDRRAEFQQGRMALRKAEAQK